MIRTGGALERRPGHTLSMKAEVRRSGLLLLAASMLFLLAYQAPTDLFFDFGPNDGDYVTGFREDFEVDEPTLIHWSLRRGRVRLPVILPKGPFEVSFRYKRHIALPAETTLALLLLKN